MPTDEWEIIGTATTEIGVQLGSDPASEAVRDYLWRSGDPKGRRLSPMPNFVATQQPDSAELERLIVGVANATRRGRKTSPAWCGLSAGSSRRRGGEAGDCK